MGLKFDGNIKLDVNVAITATFTILLFLGNQHFQQETKQVVSENSEDVKTMTKASIMKILERINAQGNFSALSEKQQFQLLNKIFNEVR